jgi:hypothetical protein
VPLEGPEKFGLQGEEVRILGMGVCSLCFFPSFLRLNGMPYRWSV